MTTNFGPESAKLASFRIVTVRLSRHCHNCTLLTVQYCSVLSWQLFWKKKNNNNWPIPHIYSLQLVFQNGLDDHSGYMKRLNDNYPLPTAGVYQ